MEKAYWEYVKANDLEKYRALRHKDFLGWPFVSSAPTRKDHITDWITANTSKGLKLQSYSIEPLAIQVTRDIALNPYRIKVTWAASDKAEVRTDALRITDTWIHPHGTRQIRGGMSAPVNEKGQQLLITGHLSLTTSARAAQTLQIFAFLILTSSFLLP